MSDSDIPLEFVRREEGLPSGQVHDLTIDNQGRLWAATPSGLATYDGSRVKVMTPRDGLSTQGLRAIASDIDGKIYVGSDSGLDIVSSSFSMVFNSGEDWSYGFVECIFCDTERAYIGTSRGLLYIENQTISEVDNPRLNHGLIMALSRSQKGTLWVASFAGGELSYCEDDRWHAPAESGWRDVGMVRCLAPTVGEYMIVGGEHGFAEINAAGSIVTLWKNDQQDAPVQAALYLHDCLWISQGSRLKTFRRKSDHWEQTGQSKSNMFINNIVADRFGNIWAATENLGVGKVSTLYHIIKPVIETSGHTIFSIKEGSHGSLLAAGDRSSWRISGGDSLSAERIEILDDRQVWDIVELENGLIFAATARGLLKVTDGKEVEFIGRGHEVLSQPNRCLLPEKDGLLIGTLGGCAFYSDNRSIQTILTEDRKPLGYVYTLTRDNDNRIWIGTLGNGVWTIEGDCAVRVVGEQLKSHGNSYAIAVRLDNTVAFVQDDGIFIKPPNQEIRLLGRSDEPIAGWTLQWAEDGSLWAGTASGLAQYNSEDGRQIRRVTALLGLSNWEFTTSRSLFMDYDGYFYCGVNSGLVRVNPQEFSVIENLPQVKLHNISFQHADVKKEDDVYVIQTGRWTMKVEVFAAWFIDEANLTYRNRLLGFEEDWSELTDSTAVRFNSLPPGDYALEIQAFDHLVGFGPVTRIIKIRVVAPSWAQHWVSAPFRFLATASHLGSALFRNRRLREQASLLEKTVQERTADLVQTKKHLEQVNARLHRQSVTDDLTGIGNRRLFDERLGHEISAAVRNKTELSLLLIDIDHFKKYNDIYGHTRGDNCLSFVARKLESSLFRAHDLVARYGGEEFAAILPGTSISEVRSVAERLRKNIVALNIAHEGAEDVGIITASIGAVTFRPLIETHIKASTLIDRADIALYRAKHRGRNCCVYFDAGDDAEITSTDSAT